jgi:hypothetical protein
MSPNGVLDWTVAALGAIATIVAILLPLNAGSTIYGTLFLMAAGAAAYFHIGTWHAPVLAVIGAAYWAAFLWNVRKKGQAR